MADYRTMYFHLMGQVANAVELLIQAQQEGEESAMREEESGLELGLKKIEDIAEEKS